MQLKIYSIRDAKGQIFNTPFYQRTHGEAERNFRTVANDPKSTIAFIIRRVNIVEKADLIVVYESGR